MRRTTCARRRAGCCSGRTKSARRRVTLTGRPTVRIDKASASAWIDSRLREAGARLRADIDICALPRARKNAVEIAGCRAAHVRDGAAVARFLAWLERVSPGGAISEIEAAEHLRSFRAEQPLYRDGQGPSAAEVAERREAVWQPYHAKIAEELQAIKARHGYALLWDAHSIRSRVPRFFEGRLPDLNLGTGDGTAADAGMIDLLGAVARDAEGIGFTHAINGRFKGGYITRHHGNPADGIHAVQLELSQITYMDEEPPYGFQEERAAEIRPVISGLIHAMLAWAELELEE